MINKNIIYILVLLCLSGLSGVSCVEEEIASGKTAPTGEAFFSLNVDLGNLPISTRSGDEKGTPDELKIYSVRIVLYDGTDNSSGSCKVEYAFDLDINTPDNWSDTSNVAGWLEGTDLYGNPGSSGQTLQFITAARRVADKPYKMLVLINGKDVETEEQQSLYSITNKGRFLHEFVKAIKLQVDPNTGTVKNGKGIFMSNHQNLLAVTQSQLAKIDTEAVGSPVTVNVDPLVAKVTVKHKSDFTFPTGVDENSATWGLAVTNKQTYWMRNELSNEISSGSMANLYAKDPNYSETGISFTEHFNKLLFQDSNGSVKVLPSSITNKINNYEYLLENTIGAQTIAETKDLLDQATHVVVGYKYTPVGFNAGDSYYIFSNQIISVADMNLFRNGGSIPSNLAGLDQVINSTDQNEYPLDGSSKAYFETGGIRFCPQGQVYYYFPIRHFPNNEGNLGYYGVVRNNIYEITINKLSVPESNNEYLSAEINIMPWNLRGQSNTVGMQVRERKWALVKLYHYFNYKEVNLYELWTKGKLEYQTVMAVVDNTISGYSYNLADEFRADLSAPYNSLHYTYCIPIELKVSANADDNVMELIYTASYAGAVQIGQIPLCFIKADGTVLTVDGIESNISFKENPHRYWLQLVTIPGYPNGTNYVFIKHIPELYYLTITDNSNKKYKITTQDLCAKYYDLKANPVINPDGTLNGIYGSAMAEPVESGSNNTVNGNRGIAIICEVE